jgi:hypothetical protein
MMKWPLTRGKFAFVDEADFGRLIALGARWQATERKRTWYASRDEHRDGRQIRVYLHRWILDAPDGSQVDHIDGDGLNCQRHNLRICSNGENLRNRIMPTRSSSRFRGVRRANEGGKVRNWFAYAHDDATQRQVYLGLWPTAILAACARDHYVAAHFPTASLNFPKGAPKSSEQVEAARIVRPGDGHPNIRLRKGRWEARVRVNGKRIFVGSAKTLEEARALQDTALMARAAP